MTDETLLRPDEAARRLRLSRAKVYSMLKKGELPSVRMGRSVRVPEEGLKRYLVGRATGNGPIELHTVEVDIDALLVELSLADVPKGTTAREIAPALVRFAQALRGANPLIRHLAREDVLHRLSEAGIRTPTKLLALAFGETER